MFWIVSKRSRQRALLGALLFTNCVALYPIKHFVNHRWDTAVLLMAGLVLGSGASRIGRFAAPSIAALSFGFTPSALVPALALGRRKIAILSIAGGVAVCGIVVLIEAQTGVLNGLTRNKAAYWSYILSNTTLGFRPGASFSSIFIAWPMIVALWAITSQQRYNVYWSRITLAASLALFPRFSAENFAYVLPFAFVAVLMRTSRRNNSQNHACLILATLSTILALASIGTSYAGGEWVRSRGDSFYTGRTNAITIRKLGALPPTSTLWIYPFLTGLYPLAEAAPFGRYLQLDPFLPDVFFEEAIYGAQDGKVDYILIHSTAEFKAIWGRAYPQASDPSALLAGYEQIDAWGDVERWYRLYRIKECGCERTKWTEARRAEIQ